VPACRRVLSQDPRTVRTAREDSIPVPESSGPFANEVDLPRKVERREVALPVESADVGAGRWPAHKTKRPRRASRSCRARQRRPRRSGVSRHSRYAPCELLVRALCSRASPVACCKQRTTCTLVAPVCRARTALASSWRSRDGWHFTSLAHSPASSAAATHAHSTAVRASTECGAPMSRAECR